MSRKSASLVVSCLAILAPSVIGTVLPVSEDSYSFGLEKAGRTSIPADLRMDKNTGKSSVLVVSPEGAAFVRFDAGDFSGQIPAGDVTGARFIFQLSKRLAGGDITIHQVTSQWSESPSGFRKAPSYKKKPLAKLSAASLRAGQFVVVDVTEEARQWLASPESDFGFAIVGKGQATYLIPSKEGPKEGAAATLEIDHHPQVESSRILAGLDANKLGDGRVDNTELGFLNGATSPIQGQLNALGIEIADLEVVSGLHGNALDHANSRINGLRDDFLDFELTVNQTTNGLRNDLDQLSSDVDTKVSKFGDSMIGALILPADGLIVGGSELTVANGRVGIGTDMPSAALEVRGDVKLGAAGNLQAAAGEEALGIVRGTILYQSGSLSLVNGSGFTFAKSGTSDITITFTIPFASTPTITFNQELSAISTSSSGSMVLRNVSKTGATVTSSAYLSGNSLHFIAIGPR